jgi:putative ABC transport system permease protein
MIKGLAKLAIRNTLRRGKKSWITAIGVFIGIAAVVSLISLGQGLETAISNEFEELGSNNVFVTGDITDRDIGTVRQARGVEAAGAYYSSTEKVEFSNQNKFVNVYGIQVDKANLIFSGQGWSVEDGRQLRKKGSTSALLGPAFEDNYDSKPEMRSQIQLNNQKFRTAGFISAGDPSAQNSVIISLERMRTIYELEDELSQIVVRIQPGFTQEEVQENIEDELRQDREVKKGNEDFSTSTPQDILNTLTNILGVVQATVVGLASIALLVGGIGIMNTMYMTINERTQEIGVLKAIGASKKQIRLLFLMEAGLIGAIGGIIGAIIGIGISEIAILATKGSETIDIARGYDITLIAAAITFSTLIGIISGYLPSRKASNLEPADALRYE